MLTKPVNIQVDGSQNYQAVIIRCGSTPAVLFSLMIDLLAIKRTHGNLDSCNMHTELNQQLEYYYIFKQFLSKKGNSADFPKAYSNKFAHIKANPISVPAQLSINDLTSNKPILILSLNITI